MRGSAEVSMFRHVMVWLLLVGSATAATPPWLDAATPLATDDVLVLPVLDVAKARAEDYNGKPFGDAPRVGLIARVDGVALGNGAEDASRWSTLPDNRLSWQFAVKGPNALALDFTFSRFRLPSGAELWIRSPDGSDWIGPFTDTDNQIHGRFHTPLLHGSDAVLELIVPADRRDFVELELESVNRMYRDLFTANLQKSGSCNIDIVCPQGAPYTEQSRSVAHYQFQRGTGTFVCTGQLAATTQPGSDTTQPTFLTAHHCVSTAAEAQSAVFYWRYESPTCRTPGSSASGSSLPLSSNHAASQSGASLLATHQPSDFTVLRLANPVPTQAQAFWSGWDRTESIPAASVSIHHPAGHEKRIALNTDPLTVSSSCIATTAVGTHWRVNNWNQGTTEGGSSGAGLWRSDSKRLIGVLSGGDAACNNLAGFDCFGRLSSGWTGGGSAASRVRDWLDPANSGATTVDGRAAASLQVTLSSPAFTTLATAGDTIALTATASGGNAPYTYEWDVDGDGVFERRGSAARIDVSYARRTATQVVVRATDGSGTVGTASRALDVRGPQIVAEAAGQPAQACGNNDGKIDPGERWTLPVRLTNTGNAAFNAGNALFSASSAQTSALALDDLDDGRVVNAIQLGGNGLLLYGQRRSIAVMTTNGYISFNNEETGLEFQNFCSGGFAFDERGPQLKPLNMDLVVGTEPGDGLRYRYFASCPRQPEVDAATPQGCHVFQWNGVTRWSGGNRFEFQAVAYARSGQIVYQYRVADPTAGGSATIGIINDTASDRLNVACNSSNAAPAQSAVCIYPPGTNPPSAPFGPDAFGNRGARTGNGTCRYDYLDIAGTASAGSPVLRLPQAVPALAALNPAASAVVNVPFEVDASAACGTPLGVDYIAAVDNRAHWFQPNTLGAGSVGTGCAPVSNCSPQIGPVPLRQRGGLFFDTNRDGNGLNTVLLQVDNSRQIFGGLWYTGERNHSPTWYQLSGELYNLAGEMPLRRFRNTAAPNGFAVSSEVVGRAWVGFTAAASPNTASDEMIHAWSIDGQGGGAERIRRLPQPFAQPNHTSAWYNQNQDGWGLAIESLATGGGNTLEFIAAYVYDASGAPRWVTGSLATVSGGTFAMLAYQPHCPGCPRYADVQQRTTAAGTLRIDYTSASAARLSSALTFPSTWPGTWVRNDLPILPLVPPSGVSAQ
jgi:lysyl endopeptidase